jgi:hypothetical protein
MGIIWGLYGCNLGTGTSQTRKYLKRTATHGRLHKVFFFRWHWASVLMRWFVLELLWPFAFLLGNLGCRFFITSPL